MKTNLNTFPTWTTLKGSKRGYIEQVFEWKEDFEKELKEEIQHLNNTYQTPIIRMRKGTIKEILGE